MPKQGAAKAAAVPERDQPLRDFLNDLYQGMWGNLCRFLRARFGDGPPDPEDMAQQAFAQFAALDDPRAIENPRGFLLRTATNLTIDHKRRQQRQARRLQLAYPTPADDDRDDLGPVRVALAREEVDILRRIIEQMPIWPSCPDYRPPP